MSRLIWLGLLLAATAGEQADRDALLALRATADLDGALNWNLSADHCLWPGVACNASGYVTQLSLSGAQLRGSLPAALGASGLCALEFLDLSRGSLAAANALTGPLPAGLANLTALTELLLLDLELTGSVPAPPGLVTLDVTSAALLSGPLPSAPGLRHLRASRSGLTGTVPPALLAQLEMLDASHTALGGTLEFDAALDCRLQSLELGYTPSLSGGWPCGLLTHCPNLTWVDVGATNISGELCADDAWEQLGMLNVAQTALGGPLPPRLFHESPPPEGYWALLAFDCSFSGSLPAELGALQLTTLSLRDNNVSGALPPELVLLPAPERLTSVELQLALNDFSGPLPNLTVVENSTWPGAELDVSSNRFSGSLPASWEAALRSSPSLGLLSLAANELSGYIPEWLTSAVDQSIYVFAYEQNSVPCPYPAWSRELVCWDVPINFVLPKCGHIVDVTVAETTGTTAVVEWALGAGDHNGGFDAADVVAYHVHLASSTAQLKSCDDVVACWGGAADSSCTITGLAPSLTYYVHVQAEYTWGNATVLHSTDALLGRVFEPVTTTNGAPEAVPVAVSFADISSVEASWTPPSSLNGFPPLRFTVVVYGAGNAVAGGCVGLSSCLVEGLSADSRYALALTVSTEGGDATSASVGFSTCHSGQIAKGSSCFDCLGEGCDGSAFCRPRFAGEACGYCEQASYMMWGECHACEGPPYEAMVLLPLVAAAMWVGYKLMNTSAVAGTLLRNALTNLQLVALSLSYAGAQSAFTTDSNVSPGYVSVLSFDVGVVHPECFVDAWNWHYLHFATVYVQPVLGAACVVAADVALRLRGADGARAYLRHAVTLAVTVYIVPYASALLQAFMCFELPSGATVLLADASVSCETGFHRGVEVAAAALLLLLALGMAALVRALRRLRRRGLLNDAETLRVYGALYWRYNDSACSMEVAMMARRVALVFVATALPLWPIAQALLGAGIATVHFVTLRLAQPYQRQLRSLDSDLHPVLRQAMRRLGWDSVSTFDMVNLLESIGAGAVAALQAVIVVPAAAGPGTAHMFTVSMVGLALTGVALYVALVAAAVLQELRRGFRDVRLRVRGEELEREYEYAVATMRELAEAKRYHFALHVKVSLDVLRQKRSRRGSATAATTTDEQLCEEQLSRVRRDAEKATVWKACPRCGADDCFPDVASVAVELAAFWRHTLARLEAEAAAGEDFVAAHEFAEAGSDVNREVVGGIAAHMQRHADEALARLDAALQRVDAGEARSALADVDALLDDSRELASVIDGARRRALLRRQPSLLRHASRRLTTNLKHVVRRAIGTAEREAVLDSRWWKRLPTQLREAARAARAAAHRKMVTAHGDLSSVLPEGALPPPPPSSATAALALHGARRKKASLDFTVPETPQGRRRSVQRDWGDWLEGMARRANADVVPKVELARRTRVRATERERRRRRTLFWGVVVALVALGVGVTGGVLYHDANADDGAGAGPELGSGDGSGSAGDGAVCAAYFDGAEGCPMFNSSFAGVPSDGASPEMLDSVLLRVGTVGVSGLWANINLVETDEDRCAAAFVAFSCHTMFPPCASASSAVEWCHDDVCGPLIQGCPELDLIDGYLQTSEARFYLDLLTEGIDNTPLVEGLSACSAGDDSYWGCTGGSGDYFE